jgi:hypothetical protein
MCAEAAGKKAVAISDVDHHPRTDAGGMERSRNEGRPSIKIGRGIANDGRLTGGAGRCVDTGNLVARHSEHPERIGSAEVGLGCERESRKVRERP